jgi:hypothetical protein
MQATIRKSWGKNSGNPKAVEKWINPPKNANKNPEKMYLN